MNLEDGFNEAIRMREGSLKMDMEALDRFRDLASKESDPKKYEIVIRTLEEDISQTQKKIALLKKDLNELKAKGAGENQ